MYRLLYFRFRLDNYAACSDPVFAGRRNTYRIISRFISRIRDGRLCIYSRSDSSGFAGTYWSYYNVESEKSRLLPIFPDESNYLFYAGTFHWQQSSDISRINPYICNYNNVWNNIYSNSGKVMKKE